MSRRTHGFGIPAASLVAVACASHPDATARRTYAAGVATERGPQGRAGADRSDDGLDLTAEGWRRVAAIFDRARPALAAGQPGRVEALVDRWCAVRPTAQPTETGPAYVCVPEPPLVLDGRTFTFEIAPARGGLVSLVSPALPGEEAARIAASARALARRLCGGTLARVEAAADAHSEIDRCALGDGTVLVVARLARDLPADLWQVSIALLGAT